MKFDINMLFDFSAVKNYLKFIMNGKTTEVWSPCDDLIKLHNNYCIMVLNTPIKTISNPVLLKNLWNQAKVRVTVDGGTEKWLHWIQQHQNEIGNVLFPDLITGDMDSVPEDVVTHFTSNCKEIKVVVTPDQDETDFFKALREVSTYCLEKNVEIDTIFVLVDSSGRLDQIIGNLNTLYKYPKINRDIRIFLFGSDSLTWLLPKGEHIIQIPSCLRENQEWCALLPLGSPCVVTTSGLKWNLNMDTLSFGGIVSSSNTYDGSCSVYVETDKPVLWSMSIETLMS